MNLVSDSVKWILDSDEPWTRYRTRLDLLDLGEEDPDLLRDREEMLAHPLVQKIVADAQTWPGYPLKRHNDAKHPIQSMTVLADFGLTRDDPGMEEIVRSVLKHQGEDGAFQTLMHLYKQFGGMEGEHWVWMGCDAPVLLYILAGIGCTSLPEVEKAREKLVSLIRENGWPCSASPNLGNFKGPGKREDPCPIANLQALKALSLWDDLLEEDYIHAGIEMLLEHWQIRTEKKFYMFGIGTDFQKLKYPLIWYDVLHMVDVLSRYPSAVKDQRFLEMVEVIIGQADDDARYTASSMYMAWKDWSFGNKKEPSPWLTFMVERIRKRVGV